MKKYLLYALLFVSSPMLAQTDVTPYTPGVNAEGVTYLLPRTVLRVDLLVEMKHYTPGEYAKYADRYLRLKDVQMEASTTCEIKEVHLDAIGKADTSKVYTVKLKDKTVAPLVKLSDSGLLLAINTDAPTNTPFAGYKEEKWQKVYNPRNYMTEEILMAGSTAKTAELCAAEIYNVRESKNNLNRGQADFMPTDGKQMEIMVNNLNEQEKALLQLFAGSTWTETKAYTFYIDPQQDINKQILFRFSKHLGVVDSDDLSGVPVYLSVKDLHTVPVAQPVEESKKSKFFSSSRKLEGIQYNIPGKAKVEIFTPQRPLLNAEVALGQFGNVETLSNALFNKKTSTRVSFYEQTGGIRSIDAEP